MFLGIHFHTLLIHFTLLSGLGFLVLEKPKDDRKFTIAILPDTQYYSEESKGGNMDMFHSQIDWIIANREKENIVYVAHLGDLVNKGEIRKQWDNATSALYKLEKPQPGLPDGIPYGVAVGNHDQGQNRDARTPVPHYNQFFGVDHFKGRSYYGGHFGADNDSHYDLFSAGGKGFIVIYVEYDALDTQQDAMNDWAVELLKQHADRKAIIISHFITIMNPVKGTNLDGQAPFGKQGQRLYDRVKTQPNLFLMLCGHVGNNGEGYRLDRYAGNAIKTLLSDYQGRENGGDGWMRLMTFDLDRDLIQVRTISPYLDSEETDGDSQFTVPLFREANGSRLYDFMHQGRSSLAFYRAGTWHISKDSTFSAGQAGYIPLAGNFFGDGRAMPALYDPQTAIAFIPGRDTLAIGKSGDFPFVGDFDGDGVTEIGTWRPQGGLWITPTDEKKLGNRKGIPVPADYDGDGVTEGAVWNDENGRWQIQGMGGYFLGAPGDIPVPADYNGDGRAEIAVYRPSTGEWIIYGSDQPILLGEQDGIPVPGDYLGNGKVEPAVFNPRTKELKLINGSVIAFDQEFDLRNTTIINLPTAIQYLTMENRLPPTQ